MWRVLYSTLHSVDLRRMEALLNLDLDVDGCCPSNLMNRHMTSIDRIRLDGEPYQKIEGFERL